MLVALAISSLLVLTCNASTARIDKVEIFITESLYSSSLKLCRESLQVAPNRFWLVSDNLLAYYALLNRSDVANEIELRLRELASKYNLPRNSDGLPISYKHEAVIGEIVPIPFNQSVTYVLEKTLDYEIVVEIANSTQVMTDWQEYADLLLYAALSCYSAGDEANAREYFDRACAMWDGIGLRDKAFEANGQYEVYKLALLLFTSKRLGLSLEFEKELCKRIWLAQDKNTGGIRTHYLPGGTVIGDANCETSSLVLLAEPSEVVLEEITAQQLSDFSLLYPLIVCLLIIGIAIVSLRKLLFS
jgi:tetratricopeptide (TPR) repeat protein